MLVGDFLTPKSTSTEFENVFLTVSPSVKNIDKTSGEQNMDRLFFMNT